MKRTGCLLLAAVLAVGSCATTPTPEPDTEEPATAPALLDIAGIWSGGLEAGGVTLRIVFRISSDGAGGYTALMDSPDQNARDIPVSAVELLGTRVRLEIAAGVFFAGELDTGSTRMEGTWNQSGASLPLALSRGEPAGPTSAETSPAADIADTWSGGLSTGTITLRMVFRITRDQTGSYVATLDSPDENLRGIPVSAVMVAGDRVRLEVAAVGAYVEGTLDPSASTIEATWNQRGVQVALVLTRGPVAEVRRPQNPALPYPYRVREVTARNETDGVTLAGTLTLPAGEGPFPAAVLITGSGQQNRDEEILQHKPFLVLADALTRAGVAVLRYDDRGVGGSTGNPAASTTEDFSRDALAAHRFLATVPEVDPRKVGLIGHSEGGIIAAMLAARSPDVAFAVLLAGPGLPGDEILLLQSAAFMRASGVGEEAIQADLVFRRRVHAIAKTPVDAARASSEIAVVMREWGVPEDQLQAAAAQFLSPWMRFFLRHDPRADLARIRQPVLALIGGRDLQVPPRENLGAITEALRQAGNTRSTTREIAGLNHLFQTAGTGLPDEYGTLEETLAPVVLETVASWILGLTTSP